MIETTIDEKLLLEYKRNAFSQFKIAVELVLEKPNKTIPRKL
jgi:hypothetical protein